MLSSKAENFVWSVVALRHARHAKIPRKQCDTKSNAYGTLNFFNVSKLNLNDWKSLTMFLQALSKHETSWVNWILKHMRCCCFCSRARVMLSAHRLLDLLWLSYVVFFPASTQAPFICRVHLLYLTTLYLFFHAPKPTDSPENRRSLSLVYSSLVSDFCVGFYRRVWTIEILAIKNPRFFVGGKTS